MNVIGIITYTHIQMHMNYDREIKLNHTESDIAFLFIFKKLISIYKWQH